MTFDPAKIFSFNVGARSGVLYNLANLQGYEFTNQAKEWVCKGLNGDLTEDNHWQLLDIKNDCHNTKVFCELFNLNMNTVKTWTQLYRKHIYQHEFKGQPKMIDHDTMLAIKEQVISARPRLTTPQICQKFKEGAQATGRLRGFSELQVHNIEAPKSSAFDSYVTAYKLNSRVGQPIFADRAKAIADSRLVCCWVVLFMTVFGQLPDYKKWNSDQSMVGIEPNGTNVRVWIANEEEVETHDRMVVENAQVLIHNI
jgi:hypothetical protein